MVEIAGVEAPVGLVATVAAVLAWLGFLALAAVSTRQPDADAGPATAELGPEPPAVANLLTNGLRVGEEAAAATALDLAARGAFDIEEVGPELSLVRLRNRPATPDLSPYELMVYEYVVRPTVDGVVATEALARGAAKPHAWWRKFRRAVIADSRARGLSHPRWTKAWRAALYGTALVPAAIGGIAARELGAGAAVWFGCYGAMKLLADERGTAAGARAAGHWLGVRKHFKDNDQIESMPAAQVTIQGRHLAYAAALEVAGSAIRSLPIAQPADDKRAWSTYGGEGLWHLVRVRYPRLFAVVPGSRPLLCGRSQWGNVARAVAWSALATVLVPGVAFVVFYSRDRTADAPELAGEELSAAWERAREFAPAVLTPVWALAAIILALVIYDLVSRHPVEGEIIRLRAYNRGSSDHPRMDYRLAVDDGAHKRSTAWLINAAAYRKLSEGDVVRVTVGRALRHVYRVEQVRPLTRPTQATTQAEASEPAAQQ